MKILPRYLCTTVIVVIATLSVVRSHQSYHTSQVVSFELPDSTSTINRIPCKFISWKYGGRAKSVLVIYSSLKIGVSKEFVDKSRILNVISSYCGNGLNKVTEISSLFKDGGKVIRDSSAKLIGISDISESIVIIPQI